MENSRWIAKQLSIIKHSSISNGVAVATLCTAIYFFWSAENFPTKLAWLQAGLALSVVLAVIPNLILRSGLTDKRKSTICKFLYDPPLFLTPFYFGYITLFVYAESSPIEMAAFSIIIAGNSVGSIITHMHSRNLSLIHVLSYMVPYSWVSFSLDSKFGITMGSAGIIFIFVLVAQIFLIHRLFRNEFSLSEKNYQLLEENKRNTEAMIENSKMVSLGRMAGGVSHEINNPLAILGSLVNKLHNKSKAGKLSNEDIVNLSDRMNHSIERIVSIVKGLRRISRDEKATDLRDYEVDILIDETLSMCKEKFKAHGVSLKRPDPSGLYLFCQPVQVSQVLMNLLNNSFDAVFSEETKEVEVQIRQERNKIIISVLDSGLGIADHHVSNIMEPFFTTKEMGKGTGLGLSISHTIMNQHNGALVFDEKSKATKFDMVFPNSSTKFKKSA